MLQLNQEKTELIIFKQKHKNRMVTKDIQLEVGENNICVKNMELYFDSSLTMEKWVNAISKTCYYHIHSSDSNRCYMRRNACKTFAHVLITSRLDYYNALLYGLPGTLMTHLQRVQKCAAQMGSCNQK